jgi:hypothetical protein
MLNTLALPAVRIDAQGKLLNTNPAWSTDYTQVISHLAQVLHPWDLNKLKSHLVEGKLDHIIVRRFGRGRWSLNSAVIVDRQHNSSSLIFSPLPVPAPSHCDSDELIGNIVHSSNNYLSAMMGFSELAMLDIKPEHIAFGQLQTVLESGNQAVSFNRDLLACVGRSVLRPQLCRWRDWLSSVMQAQNVAMTTVIPDIKVLMDEVVLTRAVSDIVRFFKEQQSVLSVESGVIDFSSLHASTLTIAAGRYAWIVLTASQRNLSNEQAEKLYQPYYSSKGMSSKKGLGLGPAAGVIKQSNGAVWSLPESTGGVTTIILLPVENSENFSLSPVRETLRSPPTPAVVPMVCNDRASPALVQQMLQSLPFAITPLSVEEAMQIDWSDANYPFYISTQINNSYWQGREKNVLLWSSFAQNATATSTTQVGVRMALDANVFMQAVNTLLKR